MAKHGVEGVYDADPSRNPTRELPARDHPPRGDRARACKVMDSTALSLCMDNDLPIYVFNMADERNIDRIVRGERVGTLVTTGAERRRIAAMAADETMIDELLADAEERMSKSVESTRNELATVRTGRASPHLLDRVVVDYYGPRPR